MDTRVEKTIERHKKGYNCAQAVACTYCDLVGVDEETMFKMTEALGLGMGCMDGTCGAVAGAWHPGRDEAEHGKSGKARQQGRVL